MPLPCSFSRYIKPKQDLKHYLVKSTPQRLCFFRLHRSCCPLTLASRRLIWRMPTAGFHCLVWKCATHKGVGGRGSFCGGRIIKMSSSLWPGAAIKEQEASSGSQLTGTSGVPHFILFIAGLSQPWCCYALVSNSVLFNRAIFASYLINCWEGYESFFFVHLQIQNVITLKSLTAQPFQ